MTTIFRWLGVAGFEVRVDGQTLLVDPFLSRPPANKLVLGRTAPNEALLRQHLPVADHILISHAHYDHLLDAPAIARYSGAGLCGSAHTCRLATVCGLPEGQIRQVQPGQHLRLGAFEVQVLAGEHAPLLFHGPGRLPAELRYPLRLRDFVLDETFSFHIRAGEVSLLAWHNCRLEPSRPADVLLLGPDISVEDLPRLLQAVRPRLFIPIHWDNFFRPLTKPIQVFFRPPAWSRPALQRYDPVQMGRLAQRAMPGMQVVIPEFFKEYDLSSAIVSASSDHAAEGGIL